MTLSKLWFYAFNVDLSIVALILQSPLWMIFESILTWYHSGMQISGPVAMSLEHLSRPKDFMSENIKRRELPRIRNHYQCCFYTIAMMDEESSPLMHHLTGCAANRWESRYCKYRRRLQQKPRPFAKDVQKSSECQIVSSIWCMLWATNRTKNNNNTRFHSFVDRAWEQNLDRGIAPGGLWR